MRDDVEVTENTIRLTEVDRQYVETFCNVNRSILKGNNFNNFISQLIL